MISSFLAFWALLCGFGFWDFTTLPRPVPQGQSSRFSEGNAIKNTEILAKDIGMRLVGTPQESMTINFLLDYLEGLKRNSVVDVFEIERQQASGSHRFDFMFEPVIKTYSNITNIIVTLSCKTCSPDALLMNSHFDSTIVTPGAADDAASVSIMLELIRILSSTETEKLKKTAIFLFNGAEETLQDGSHAFLTQHPLAPRVKAVINMEAMGAKGQEILFQANSPFLISKYAAVPHPHASSLSNDVFKTGLLLSDTDFRQFLEYGHDVIGLDFAYYKNSYHYHTNLDVVENIQAGSIQHFGDNVLELIKGLVWNQDDWDMERERGMVYFVYPGGLFIYYSRATSIFFHAMVVFVSMYTCRVYARQVLGGMGMGGMVSSALQCLVALIVGIGSACLEGVLMALRNPMSWFSSEFYAILCFSVPFLVGMEVFSLAMSWWSKRCKSGRDDDAVVNVKGRRDEERTWLLGFTLLFAFLLAWTTWTGLASSYLLLFHTIFLTVGLVVDYTLSAANNQRAVKKFKDKRVAVEYAPVSPLVYFIIMAPVVSFGAMTGLSIIYVFVPITGRIGLDAPVDVLIPIIVSLAMIMSQAYLLLPISCRASIAERRRAIRAMGVITIVIASIFCLFISPYTPQQPKRLYVSFMENTTSSERGVHVSYADIGRRDDAIKALEKEFNVKAEKRSKSQTDRDWATLFPFSRFVENYQLNLTSLYPTPLSSKQPRLSSTSTNHANGTKSIHLTCHYDGFVWSVISFEAVVLQWSLGIDPVAGKDKYTIRHVGGHGGKEWSIDLLVNTTQPVHFEVTGVEREGFERLIPNSHQEGFRWLWSDHFESAAALRRCDDALPEWTTFLLVGIVAASHTVS